MVWIIVVSRLVNLSDKHCCPYKKCKIHSGWCLYVIHLLFIIWVLWVDLDSTYLGNNFVNWISVYCATDSWHDWCFWKNRSLQDVSVWTIQSTYSEMTNLELDSVIADIHWEFPMYGNKQIGGHLLSRGIVVQQHWIRESMRTIDPEGTLVRRLNVIHRHCYSVPSPRSLYHIDRNHKLIR